MSILLCPKTRHYKFVDFRYWEDTSDFKRNDLYGITLITESDDVEIYSRFYFRSNTRKILLWHWCLCLVFLT